MNAIERIEELAAKASERPWQTSKPGGALVTQGRCANPAAGAEDRAYYGGALVGESIGRADQEFIAAVVNALPDLLRVIHEVAPEHQLAADGSLAAVDGCALCRALAPLFAETALVEQRP